MNGGALFAYWGEHIELGFWGVPPQGILSIERTIFSFWLLLLITQFVLFFFFEAVYIEIIFILKDNKTIESNEFFCLSLVRANNVLNFTYCSYSIPGQYSLGQKFLHNKGLQQLNYTPFFLGFTLLSSYVLFYLRHENTTVITI